uniref:Uncharacterized protein n=1 Tax=Oryzias sinensis TaxID=183150 RepID=A0A8C7Z052_9TELE
MTSDQDTKVVAEPQVQQVQEAKENAHLVSFSDWDCITQIAQRMRRLCNFKCASFVRFFFHK